MHVTQGTLHKFLGRVIEMSPSKPLPLTILRVIACIFMQAQSVVPLHYRT
jgi:hypothetical protein